MFKKYKTDKVTTAFLWAVVAIFIGLTVIVVVRWNNQFVYVKALEEEVFSYHEGTVRLRDVSYYIMIEEETVNEMAMNYDPEHPIRYWNLHLQESYVDDEAKVTALSYCIRDVLYAQLAKSAGLELTEEQKEDVRTKAENIESSLTDKQRSIGLTYEDIYVALENNLLADTYVIQLAEERGLTMSEEVLSAYYGINSSFFEEVKEEYRIVINDKVWNEVSLGKITIN